MGETEMPIDPEFGKRMLTLLNLAELIGKTIPYTDKEGVDKQVQGENFMDVCGEHALPQLQTLDLLSQQEPRHPRYDAMVNATRNLVAGRLGISLEAEQ